MEDKKPYAWTYCIGHWVFTLFLSPFVADLVYFLFIGYKASAIGGLIDVYPIALVFSIVFASPTILVYSIAYAFLRKRGLSKISFRLIFSGIIIVGTLISFFLVFHDDLKIYGPIAYGLTALIGGFVIRLRQF